jgi:hypothetical protein
MRGWHTENARLASEDNAMHDWDPRIIEAIDGCRPGSDDLDDPELLQLRQQMAVDAELRAAFVRVQKLDARLATAIGDVPVPEGLESRILARLREARRRDCQAGGEQVDAAGHDPAKQITRWPRKSRRRWMVAAAISAALAVSVAVVAVMLRRPADSTIVEIVGQVRDEFAQQQTAQWNAAGQQPKMALSRFVVAGRNLRWRPVTISGSHGVAYDVTQPGKARATLYMVPTVFPGLPTLPPTVPVSTQGLSTAVWNERGVLCLLVVAGGPRDYHRYIDVPPLAFLPIRGDLAA